MRRLPLQMRSDLRLCIEVSRQLYMFNHSHSLSGERKSDYESRSLAFNLMRRRRGQRLGGVGEGAGCAAASHICEAAFAIEVLDQSQLYRRLLVSTIVASVKLLPQCPTAQRNLPCLCDD